MKFWVDGSDYKYSELGDLLYCEEIITFDHVLDTIDEIWPKVDTPCGEVLMSELMRYYMSDTDKRIYTQEEADMRAEWIDGEWEHDDETGLSFYEVHSDYLYKPVIIWRDDENE